MDNAIMVVLCAETKTPIRELRFDAQKIKRIITRMKPLRVERK